MEFHGSHNNNLTPTGLAHKLIGEIMFLANLLLDLDQQRIIKKYCDVILQNRSAISDATNLLPLEAALVVILATEHQNNNREISDLYKEFYERINELSGEVGKLRNEIEELKILNEKV